ncbi:uncharacterized protein EI90DRAFT_3019455 [Cantharellus anzutake]|uniref:uncharacterized protein n=1 Tax=Cantharellus anzutake TaxID=1750568 RepID=UPI0019059F7A|nr:uncharacterized protein EI90DRAFT_3019455 [Cantharellus anzutake]KAF8324699.1 hypothetical protein EI90DRAFT_3019455 [Cantharellus anzutake]
MTSSLPNELITEPDSRRKIGVKGDVLLETPYWNKGTAFTAKEREEFDLIGRLPYRVNTLDQQCERAWRQLEIRETPMRKNSFLQSLKAQNWVLYYALILRHLRELIPIIYTPTEAEAISNYSTLFRRSEGLYLSFPNAHRMEEDYLSQTRNMEIELISTAKAAIYTLVGGVHPAKALPVVLDVGTDNEHLLNDPLYVGWPERRVTGDQYDDFVDKFVQLVRRHHPHCLLHFEDFGVENAERLLEKYRETHAVFNDDVQGTGAVTLAALTAACHVTKSKLSHQRIVVYGAGSAGLGITHQLREAIIQETGLPHEEASKRFYLIDKAGLITESVARQTHLRRGLLDFVRPDTEWTDVKKDDNGAIRLLEVVKKIKPTVLIGTSTHGGAFTRDIVAAMSEGVERPIIFPLSNPSRLAEVDPKDANEWSDDKALLATGSPFPAVKMKSGKEYQIAECNNALIYPGLGYGSMISKARQMSNEMIVAGTQALAKLSPALRDPDLSLLPDFEDARAANTEVAVAVATQAIKDGLADVDWGVDEVREKVEEKMWVAEYEEYGWDADGEKL